MSQKEIKFRAWGRDTFVIEKPFTMAHFSLKDVIENDRVFITDSKDDLVIMDYEGAEIMQYTGLKDKNGKEIYEGDIFTMLNIDYLVEWNDRKGKWNFYCPELSHPSYWGLTAGQMKRCKIIGNIYENPDLLSPSPKQ